MRFIHWAECAVPPEATLGDVLGCIDNNAGRPCVVVDSRNVCLSVVTQGDARRMLLSGASLLDSISSFSRPFAFVSPDDDQNAVRSEFNRLGIDFLPVVRDSGEILGIWSDENQIGNLPVSLRAIILAGGLGERLQPITYDIPKPLIKVGGVSLLDRNIAHCLDHGFREIFISVGYLKDKVEAAVALSFGKGQNIRFVEETNQLGTAGPLSLLPRDPADVLVLNSDLLHGVNLRDLYQTHKRSSADLTVVVRFHDTIIPFGVLNLDGSRVLGVSEKPHVKSLVSAGIYMVGPKVRELVEPNKKLDMPQLIEIAIEEGLNVEAFMAHEYWLDVGTHETLAIAESQFADEAGKGWQS